MTNPEPVRSVHYTAQQYFERSHREKLREARLSLTTVSLKYLTLPNFSSGICTTDTAMSQRLERYPFLDYAAKLLGFGSRQIWRRSASKSLQKFALNSAAVDSTNQAWCLRGPRYTNWSQEFPKGVPALALAATFDLPEVLRQMVQDGHDIEGKGTDGETARSFAPRPLVTRRMYGLFSNWEPLSMLVIIWTSPPFKEPQETDSRVLSEFC